MKENQVVNIICAEIRDILGQDMVSELVRYRTAFPKEPDYNFVQHGHLLVSDHQVREFYAKRLYFPRCYPLGDNGMEAILKIYNKSYTVVIREVTTMHVDDIFIPWENAKSFVEDDGFAMDMLNVSDWVAQYEIQCAFDDFMHEGTDTYHSCYWEDMEDCDWFEEELMIQK